MPKPGLIIPPPLNPVQAQQYERYLPNAFDESLSILEKMNKIIYYMQQIGEITQEMLDRWNEVYEWVLGAGLEEAVNKKLDEWLLDGTLGEVVQDVIEKYIGKIDDIIEAETSLNLKKAKNIYLFDLMQDKETVNQSIVFDEVNNQIFAVQGYNLPADTISSYYINRLTLGGRYLDSMLVRYGGHGTSIGLEIENGVPYIWSNIIKPDIDQTAISTQYLSRFPYRANQTMQFGDIAMESYQEFPDPYVYHTPISDNKNGLLGIRITDSTGGVNKSKIEIKRFQDVKNKLDNKVYSYTFTDEMNKQILQGMTFDHNMLYLTFGNSADAFTLYHVDMKTGEILKKMTSYELDFDSSKGAYENNYHEPEGIYLYTDPRTKQKTLFHVLVTDTAGRRRNRLYAISSNTGINIFQGFSNANSLQFPLLSNTGAAKRLPITATNLKQINEPGTYYLSLAETNILTDHPFPGVAGWYFTVSARDTGKGVMQTLDRVSSVYSTSYKREVSSDGVETVWDNNPALVVFENGYENYNTENNKAQYYRNNGVLYIAGIVKKSGSDVATGDRIFTLPPGFRPSVKHAFMQSTSNGIMEMSVNGNGSVQLDAFKVKGATNPTFIYINCIVGIM